MTGFPHPRHDDAPAGGVGKLDRGEERLAEAIDECAHGVRLDLQDFLRECEDARGIGKLPGMV